MAADLNVIKDKVVASQSDDYILQIKNISKTFLGGKIIANKNISLDFKRGKVHALVGENGSGKTTLTNILFGLYKKDAGTIIFNNEEINPTKFGTAKALGIGMVHQHFNLVDKFSILDNVILGQEDTVTGFMGVISKAKAIQRYKEITEKYNINLSHKRIVKTLSVGDKQKVEIIKVLWEDKKLIILDEPTATLSVSEIEELINTMAKLLEDGITIIFISHKLAEVKRVSDQISVLRKGEVVGTFDNDDSLTPKRITELMVKKKIDLEFPRRELSEQVIFEAKDIFKKRMDDSISLRRVGFEVRANEIFGIGGIEGNGQEELLEAISGITPQDEGTFHWNGIDITNYTTMQKSDFLAHIPSDRIAFGIVPTKDLKFNSILSNYNEKMFSKWYREKLNDKGLIKRKRNLIVDNKKIEPWAEKIVKEFNVDGAYSLEIPIKNLSGGNQQKFVVGREVLRDHKLLLAGHPTRGLDILSIRNIYTKMIEDTQKEGRSTILYSLEMSELISVCDRIAIMYEGNIIKIISTSNKQELNMIPQLMVGVDPTIPQEGGEQ